MPRKDIKKGKAVEVGSEYVQIPISVEKEQLSHLL